jgi:choice-of-anchor B domain-containing protein
MSLFTRFTLLVACFNCSVFDLFAQQNLSLLGKKAYPELTASCWGYTAPDGTEYAIVGTRKGAAIVSLKDPTTLTEVAYLTLTTSIWREMRVWKNNAYIVCDACSDGVVIADLSQLPSKVTFKNFKPTVPGLGDLRSVHTINIDEKGTMYLNGSNLNGGSPIFFDLNANPDAPVYTGKISGVYVHDSYARGDTLYTADQNNPSFSIYDIRSKTNPLLLGNQRTPTRIAHNVWLSDNSKRLYVTEETSNAPISSYDISDPSNINELFRFNRAATLGTGVISHNVLTLKDWLVVANYTDGVSLIDVHRPEVMVETGNYKTSRFTSGFSGVWGAFPYFPSGIIIASDIEEGLIVLKPNYVRASYLFGNISDAVSKQKLANVEVRITGKIGIAAVTSASGGFSTGAPLQGQVEVQLSLKGYEPKTVMVNLAPAVVTTLTEILVPLKTAVDDVLEAAGFKAYPNPVTDQLQLQWSSNGPIQITLMDAQGRTVYQAGLSAPTAINMAGLTPGLYLGRVWMQESGKVGVFRVIKQ